MDIKQQEIITQTIAFVKKELSGAEGGHDWFHIYRVWKTAIHIAKIEEADLFIVNIAALLHDIADAKFYNGNEEIGPEKARKFLHDVMVDENDIDHIVKIIRHVSFKNRNEIPDVVSKELQIVQDADRLDAIGAIGIARAFNFGGFKGRSLYNPEQPPNLQMSKAEYKAANSPTINHFYEKLLLLKDMMNTNAGKEIARHRHLFMENFLKEFYDEWEGIK